MKFLHGCSKPSLEEQEAILIPQYIFNASLISPALQTKMQKKNMKKKW